jgi:hypothetical protein
MDQKCRDKSFNTSNRPTGVALSQLTVG